MEAQVNKQYVYLGEVSIIRVNNKLKIKYK